MECPRDNRIKRCRPPTRLDIILGDETSTTLVNILFVGNWDLLTRSGFEGYLESVEGKH